MPCSHQTRQKHLCMVITCFACDDHGFNKWTELWCSGYQIHGTLPAIPIYCIACLALTFYVIMLCNKKKMCIWCEHSFSPNETIISFWVSSDVTSFLLIAMHKLSCTHTSFALEVGEWWDENLVEEERAAVHLYRPGQKAAKVIDIPKKDREREKCRWYKVRSKRDGIRITDVKMGSWTNICQKTVGKSEMGETCHCQVESRLSSNENKTDENEINRTL